MDLFDLAGTLGERWIRLRAITIAEKTAVHPRKFRANRGEGRASAITERGARGRPAKAGKAASPLQAPAAGLTAGLTFE
jgi:hypothetical protein